MINYNKNELINEALSKYYETFQYTLDTADFVPDEFNAKILKYIFKNLKKTFRKIDKEDKIYQRELIKQQKIELEKQKEPKISFWQKIKNHFSKKKKSKNEKINTKSKSKKIVK